VLQAVSTGIVNFGSHCKAELRHAPLPTLNLSVGFLQSRMDDTDRLLPFNFSSVA
jgi:hypothetical protein